MERQCLTSTTKKTKPSRSILISSQLKTESSSSCKVPVKKRHFREEQLAEMLALGQKGVAELIEAQRAVLARLDGSNQTICRLPPSLEVRS